MTVAILEEVKIYEKGTIGYYYKIVRIVFGLESATLKFLHKKADEAPNGFDETFEVDERQLFYVFWHIHTTGEWK